ncbi:MAG TPA: hypothetical protein VKE98_17220 [Gemmataceae bacterium]|nr:hypothetical protein [Gemmataceae bacterium]
MHPTLLYYAPLLPLSTPCRDFVEKFFAPLVEKLHQPGYRAGDGPVAGFIAGHGGFGQAEEIGQLIHREVVFDADLVKVCWFHTTSIAGGVANVNYPFGRLTVKNRPLSFSRQSSQATDNPQIFMRRS